MTNFAKDGARFKVFDDLYAAYGDLCQDCTDQADRRAVDIWYKETTRAINDQELRHQPLPTIDQLLPTAPKIRVTVEKAREAEARHAARQAVQDVLDGKAPVAAVAATSDKIIRVKDGCSLAVARDGEDAIDEPVVDIEVPTELCSRPAVSPWGETKPAPVPPAAPEQTKDAAAEARQRYDDRVSSAWKTQTKPYRHTPPDLRKGLRALQERAS